MVALLTAKRSRPAIAVALASLAFAGAFWQATTVRGQGQVREITILGDHYAFNPTRIEVQKDDLVKVTFKAQDLAHSFTVDTYRIAKRAAAGQTVVFEFRADQVGTFPFYCNLTQDERCREMKGQLIVR
jgi:cytochrome c oxidase subunit 2